MNSNKILQLTRDLERIANALEEMWQRYTNCKASYEDSLVGNFPELAPKWEHNTIICQMAYNRIYKLYLKKLDEITSIV